MAPVPVAPRDLTRAEREVLEFLLSADFAGADRLRAQIPHCRVVAVWAAGQPSVDLAVPETVAPAQVPDGEIPAGAEVRDGAGQYVGEVLVWVEGGCLSAIEYAWVTDEAPDRLPDVSSMKLVRLQPEEESSGSGSDHAS
jgi:hypothetical protein